MPLWERLSANSYQSHALQQGCLHGILRTFEPDNHIEIVGNWQAVPPETTVTLAEMAIWIVG
jgi:hypothetical protein